MFYDKNFGNALFNVIQNAPNNNTAVVGGVVGAVDANSYTLLTNLLGTGAFPVTGSATHARSQHGDSLQSGMECWC